MVALLLKMQAGTNDLSITMDGWGMALLILLAVGRACLRNKMAPEEPIQEQKCLTSSALRRERLKRAAAAAARKQGPGDDRFCSGSSSGASKRDPVRRAAGTVFGERHHVQCSNQRAQERGLSCRGSDGTSGGSTGTSDAVRYNADMALEKASKREEAQRAQEPTKTPGDGSQAEGGTKRCTKRRRRH